MVSREDAGAPDGGGPGTFHTVSSIRLANRAAELRRLGRWFDELAADLAIDADARYRLDLILNEAANNIIDYAWDGGEHHFSVTAARRDGEVRATLEDDGRPFNPLEYPPPARVERIEDAPVGGLGIHLIRSQCDAWYYQATATGNRLSVSVWSRGRGAGGARGARNTRGPDRRRRAAAVEFPLRTPAGALLNEDRRADADRRANAFISRQQLCSDIPYGLVEPVLAACEQRRLEAGEVLLAPGELNDYLFLVLNGRLQVHLDAVDSRLGFPIESGECIGEMSVIDGKPVSAFVVAKEPSTVLPVHRDVFWDRLAGTPLLARNLMQLLAERMRRRNDVMLDAMAQQLRLEHLARELATARELQAGMLPKQVPLFPDHPRVDAHAIMEPANEVGGDFFDAFAVDGEHVCVAVGDVSDKGIPAALFMVRTMTLLRMEMRSAETVDGLLAGVNRQLATGNRSCMFVTVFVAVLNVVTGQLRYANGGHPPPLLQHSGGGSAPIPMPRGILLGVDERARFEVAELAMNPGDVLTFYTDGITEAENPRQEQFSEARLRAAAEDPPGTGAAARVDGIRDAVRAFAAGAPQSDDLTLLVLRYRGD